MYNKSSSRITLDDPIEDLAFHLDQDEELLWSGKPKSGIVFRASDAFMIPFSVLWCSFAVFWFVSALQAPFPFALFGIPFVLIGLLMVFGRFIIDARDRDRTSYGLTNKRIIIESGVFSRKFKSVPLKTLSELELKQHSDGTGTIRLGPKSRHTAFQSGMTWWPGVQVTPQLELIPAPHEVYAQILDAQNALR